MCRVNSIELLSYEVQLLKNELYKLYYYSDSVLICISWQTIQTLFKKKDSEKCVSWIPSYVSRSVTYTIETLKKIKEDLISLDDRKIGSQTLEKVYISQIFKINLYNFQMFA